MGKPPAVIIIARHGSRLDAVDKNWHLTSPTPYDPPLTYGGWNQSRALGARIVGLLQAREDSDPDLGSRSTDGNNDGGGIDGRQHNTSNNNNKRGRSRKRKHQIIIHTSPYLRCLQTAVAVSSGISQYHPQDYSPDSEQSICSQNESNNEHGNDSSDGQVGNNERDCHRMTRQSDTTTTATATTTSNSNTATGTATNNNNHLRCLLRVDAFLGEWLNPDYFDHISPPPVSERMVTTAKTALLQQGEAIAGLDVQASFGNFPGGWGSSSSTPVSPDNADRPAKSVDLPAANVSLLLQHQSRNRAASCGTPLSHPVQQSALAHRQSLSRLNTSFGNNVGDRDRDRIRGHDRGRGRRRRGYAPPVPGYAVSPSDKIPRGYVAHARDACVDVDYSWDSTREPHNWGDGAQYGEEWSSMHKRFRNGLQRMADWYRVNDRSQKQYHGRPLHQSFSHRYNDNPHHHAARERNDSNYHDHNHNHIHSRDHYDDDDVDDDDEYTDTALVIITHGSGCNALIGALSGQPALIDVGMASLTMAVRKDNAEKKPTENGFLSGSSDYFRSSFDLPVAHEYDIKVLASADHLRSGNDPSKVPPASCSSPVSSSSSPNPPTIRPTSSSYRRRLGTMSSLPHGQFVMVGSGGGDSSSGNNGTTTTGGTTRSIPSRPSSSSPRTSAILSGSSSSSPRDSPGLWGSTSVAVDKNSHSPSTEDMIVPNFSDLQHPTRSKSVEYGSSVNGTRNNRLSGELWSRQLPQRTPSQRGLWGGFPLKTNESQGRR